MTTRSLSILVWLFATTVPSLARLGETEDQSITRYGQPIFTASTSVKNEIRHDYFKNGILIKAIFFQGACCSISYKKTSIFSESPDDAYKDSGLKFTEAEILLILKQNNQGQFWTTAPGGGGGAVWVRKDGGTALYNGAFFCVDSPEFAVLANLAGAANKKSDEATARKSVGGL